MLTIVKEAPTEPTKTLFGVVQGTKIKTTGSIVIKHPAIKEIDFYDDRDNLLKRIPNLTDLSAQRIVNRQHVEVDFNAALAYIKVKTADSKVHRIEVR